MVNNVNVSHYQGEPPIDGVSRKITGGPLYAVENVILILNFGGSVVQRVTRKCRLDVQTLGFDNDDLIELIQDCLKFGRYIDSEWCNGKKSDIWFACDAYSVNRREWNSNARKIFDYVYYLKFAVGKNGKLILMASCHLSS